MTNERMALHQGCLTLVLRNHLEFLIKHINTTFQVIVVCYDICFWLQIFKCRFHMQRAEKTLFSFFFAAYTVNKALPEVNTYVENCSRSVVFFCCCCFFLPALEPLNEFCLLCQAELCCFLEACLPDRVP